MGEGVVIIENKLIQFTKKYYLNKLIRGVLYSSLFILVLIALLIVVEYFSYLSALKKSILVSSFLIVILYITITYIVFPLLGFIGLRIKVTKKTINKLIVQNFPEIKDSLWNLLELKDQKNTQNISEELVIASIEQRIKTLKIFDFNQAIKLKDNLKLVYLSGIAIMFSLIIGWVAPEKIKNPGKRLMHFTENYIKPSPYSYNIINENMVIGKGEDFNLKVWVDAKEEFDNVLLNFGGNSYLMKQDSLFYYSYQFNNVNNSIDFNFKIENYLSEEYELKVLPKPILTGFKVNTKKPGYTNLKSDAYENITELIVPLGTVCEFEFRTFETDTVIINLRNNDNVYLSDNFKWSKIILSDEILDISIKNKYFTISDYLKVEIRTINDEFPEIDVAHITDSIDLSQVYFKGQISDDYGFSQLKFVTKLSDNSDSIFDIQIAKNVNQQDFFYAFDFNELKSISRQFQYYFEVFDNDNINGYKSSVSEMFSFEFPDAKEILEYQDEQFDNIEEILSNSMNLTNQLRNDLKDFQQKMINSDLTDWERNEMLKNLYSKEKSLEEAIKAVQEKNADLNNYMESFTERDQKIIDKQKEIEKILEEVMSDELQSLLDEFKKMMSEFNQNRMNELSEEFDISLDDLSKQLDKNLELLKKMKIEQELDLIIQNLKEKIENQKNISDQLEQGEKPENLADEQQKEKEDLGALEDNYEKTKKLNDELEEKSNLYDFEDEFNKIKEELDNSIEQQNKNNRKKSQESIKQNIGNMQNLAFMMEQMKDAAFAEQTAENLEDLLQILDNTVIFSFNQENLIISNISNDINTKIFGEQRKLYQDFQVIKDSLYALAKRQSSVDAAVNKEIVSIESSFRKIDKNLSEGLVPQAKLQQQIVLTSANNLALFLSEVIKNLQQQMANSMPGNQNCQKPGNNPNQQSSNNSMKSMQQSLQQQLEKMMQMMKDGATGQQMQGEMGKALSQQEKMQSMLQNMMNQGNVGSNAYETMKQADQMLNQIRQDIIRNNISNQTVKRNKEILTKLLEAENADMERDLDDKRKSNTADKQRISETAKYFDNNLSNNNFKEKLIRQKLVLNKYYQNRYQNYLNELDSINGSQY